MFTVVIFNDGRNDYLEQTLDSFVREVRFPVTPHFILVDDMPEGRDDAFLQRLAARFRIDEMVLHDRNLGQCEAIMAAWSRIPKVTEFVFHLENDFVFPERVDVAELAAVLTGSNVCNVTLLRQPWYEDERAAGSLIGVRPERFEEQVVNGFPVLLHTDYFGFNPGLYRRDCAQVYAAPQSVEGEPWLERIHRDRLLAQNPNTKFAVFGRRDQFPRVLHIGIRRVGRSPDHGGQGYPVPAGALASETSAPNVQRPAPGRRRRRPCILLYHRIAAPEVDSFGLSVDPVTFRSQMEWLAHHMDPLSLDEVLSGLTDDNLPERAIAITIDDGYADALMASETLLDMNLPVTLFVTSMGGETFHDTVARIFLSKSVLPPHLDVSIDGLSISMDTSDRAEAFRVVNDAGWDLTESGRLALIEALRRWSGLELLPRESHRLLRPVEVRDFASRRRHRIGSHSVNHLQLPAQSLSSKVAEIRENRLYLNALTRTSIDQFAYPYGAVDAESIAICRHLAFQGACGVGGGSLELLDLMNIGRIEIRQNSPWPPPCFEA